MRLLVNGVAHRLECDPAMPLLWVLRERLKLTGTKYGCGEGECGACTVLVAGQPVRSCVLPVSAADGKPVVTIEGLARDGQLHPVQKLFLAHSAFQCGFCTPGMILAAAALLGQKPRPSAAEIARRLEGHICRCGSYPRIIEAIRHAG